MYFDDLQPITALNGAIVERWSGVEMALSGGSEVLDEFANEDGALQTAPVVWEHSSIPFVQFTHLDLSLRDGRSVRIVAEAKGVSGSYGLRLMQLRGQATNADVPGHIIYRKQELPEFPIGAIQVEVLREANSLAAIDVLLSINGVTIRLFAGEVYERDGKYEIVEADETILVQLNGQRPKFN
jgi:hypothetical protein